MITYRRLGKLGQLGNQLFQYAGTRLYAEEHGFHWAFPKWIGNEIFEYNEPYTMWEYLYSRALPTCQLDDLQTYTKFQFLRSVVFPWYHVPSTYSLRALYERPRDHISLFGYLQDPLSLDLLRKHRERVRRWFTFQPHIEEALAKLMNPYRPWVAVHIRRGDYVRLKLALPVEQYAEALEKVRRGRNVIICTNDKSVIQELKEFNPIQVENTAVNILPFVFDFWILKNAETVIGGGSTFSWWAAFLNKSNDYYSPSLTHLWKQQERVEITKQEF